jgi:acetyl-CoA carboxylase beta subunit
MNFSFCDPLTFKDQKNHPERLKRSSTKNGFTRCCSNGDRFNSWNCSLLWTSFHGRYVQAVKGILLLIEYATKKGLTVILICASGGVQKVL